MTLHLCYSYSSSYHDPSAVVEVGRKEKDGEILKIKYPVAIHDYNLNMNFVDKFDQLKKTMKLTEEAINGGIEYFSTFLMPQL